MQKISYSQNYEDVVLARVFHEIKIGNYIDVGAHNPKVDSVTKYFYDLGWSGINVEPLDEEFQLLVTDRPRDLNFNLCAGKSSDKVEFVFVRNRSGWSSSNEEQISKIIDNNDLDKEIRLVQQETLNKLLENADLKEIHFLKIDVEGSEQNVLEGIDFKKHRPWVILIEATEPGSKNSTHKLWEHLILRNDYNFVYSDGINRFYLANEHKNLTDRFGPPNAFDHFIPLVAFEYYLQYMHQKAKVAELENKIMEIYSSRSWRFTIPIRKITHFLKKPKVILNWF